MRKIFIFMTIFVTAACSGGGGSPAAPASPDVTPASQTSAKFIVNRNGSILKSFSAMTVQCQRSNIKITDSAGELSLFFDFNPRDISSGTYSLLKPGAIYFDSAFQGKVLGWDNTLPKCDFIVSTNEQKRVKGSLDCYKTRQATETLAEVVNIQGDFECSIQN
jgi:hypothetical protein